MTPIGTLRIGDRVAYRLSATPKNYQHERFLPGTVLNITARRVIIKLDGFTQHRTVVLKNLRKLP